MTIVQLPCTQACPGLVGRDKLCLGRWSAKTLWHLGFLRWSSITLMIIERERNHQHCDEHGDQIYETPGLGGDLIILIMVNKSCPPLSLIWTNNQFWSSFNFDDDDDQVGCYCWLDKLGMAARYRVTTVIRQVTRFRYRVATVIRRAGAILSLCLAGPAISWVCSHAKAK